MKVQHVKTRITHYDKVSELPEVQQQLVQAAREAMKTTHSPYSHFPVGAALLLDDGTIVIGSNQENASFPLGICAERIALANYAMLQPRGRKVKAVAVCVDSYVAAPCGMCRQALLEQEHEQEEEIEVLMQGEDPQVLKVDSIASLLPLPFFSQNLKR